MATTPNGPRRPCVSWVGGRTPSHTLGPAEMLPLLSFPPYSYGVMGPEHSEQLVAVLDELDQAIRHAATVLEQSRKANRVFRNQIVKQRNVRDAFLATPAREEMASVAAALKHLEETRHRSRTVIFAAGLDEGLSIGELSRLYGFSRQLAQRFAKEARDQQAEPKAATQ